MLSEAARLRSQNTGERSPTYQDPRYRQETTPQRENFSARARQVASIRNDDENPQMTESSGPGMPHKYRSNTNPVETRLESGRERGFSEAPASMSTTFTPSRPLRNSFSIPELSGVEWQNAAANPVDPRIRLRLRENSPNPDRHPNFTGYGHADEIRESVRSVQTTGTAATGTTWMTSTTSTTWGTNTSSGFLDTERSSIMSKGSSARSVNGRDQIDDFLDMYDGGFTESEAEEETPHKRHSTGRSIKYESGNNITTPELDSNTLVAPKFPHLIIRDSADMFRTADAYVDPFDGNGARNTNGSDPQSPYQPTPGIIRQPSGIGGIGGPISQFDATRDIYGFKKKSQHVSLADYETWNSGYVAYLARRRRKWTAVLRDNGLDTEHPTRFPPKSTKIKRFVRKGIPPDWRGEAWFWYAGGHQLVAKHPGVYDDLVRRATHGDISPTDEELIERDLHRTFPDNILFKPDTSVPVIQETSTATPTSLADAETPILKSLRRVLQATSIYNPKIGYCQSLNFLAGLLLLFMSEERSFWMLDTITKSYLPNTHEVNLEGANVDLGVLMMCVRDSMPAIWAKIGGELDGSSGADHRQVPMQLPPITLCCTAWFMSCFIGTLPIETTLRVWDTFFFEGSKTLFRVALAIFKVGEAEIRAVNDPMEVFQVVQTIPRRLIDANALMHACFKRRNGFGHLTQNTVDAKRAERRKAYADARAVAAGERPSSKRSNLFASIRSKK